MCFFYFEADTNQLYFSVVIIPRIWTVWFTANVCNKKKYAARFEPGSHVLWVSHDTNELPQKVIPKK